MNSIDKKKNLTNPQPKFTGCFDDFLIISLSNEENKIQKEKKETKYEDKNKEIINCGDVENFLSNIYTQKKNQNETPQKSRFSDFFKEMEEQRLSLEKPSRNSSYVISPTNINLNNLNNNNNENINPTSVSSINNLDSYKKSINSDYYKKENVSLMFKNIFKQNEIEKDIKINSNLNNNNNNNSNNNDNINNQVITNNINNNSEDKNAENIISEKFGLNVDMLRVLNFEDTRTTIMIKNIPNKFTRELLINIIDQNFRGTYDVFILPTDSNHYKNFGYSFINFKNSYFIPYFYYMFNGNKWSFTNSKKICEITYSKIQGKNNLLNHYPSKIIYENKEVDIINQRDDYLREFIIPNVYKDMFLSLFPSQRIMVFPYFFLTLLPIKK